MLRDHGRTGLAQRLPATDAWAMLQDDGELAVEPLALMDSAESLPEFVKAQIAAAIGNLKTQPTAQTSRYPAEAIQNFRPGVEVQGIRDVHLRDINCGSTFLGRINEFGR